jgi:hypothetical protein
MSSPSGDESASWLLLSPAQAPLREPRFRHLPLQGRRVPARGLPEPLGSIRASRFCDLLNCKVRKDRIESAQHSCSGCLCDGRKPEGEFRTVA